MAGWSTFFSSHDRVELTMRPARLSARSRSAWLSGLSAGTSSADAHRARQCFELRGTRSRHRPRTEQVGQERVVEFGAPRKPGVLHLGSDERSGRLGREQEAQPPGFGAGRERILLEPELGQDRVAVGIG